MTLSELQDFLLKICEDGSDKNMFQGLVGNGANDTMVFQYEMWLR